MKSLWDENEARKFSDSAINMRVYTSRLLGRDPSLVLHGGGNTSVKVIEKNIFGEDEEILYVKGSGWDLETIQSQGFSPVRMSVLKRLAELDQLSDTQMVQIQKSAMTNPAAPSPSIEAILHAVIPFRFVDHTHADAVVTITNSKDGIQAIKEIYGKKLLIVPYVMPGFILAKTISELTKAIDWNQLQGMILLHHGVFSFSDDAKESYERMIDIVSQAENYIRSKEVKLCNSFDNLELNDSHLKRLTSVRQQVSQFAGRPMLALLYRNPRTISFSNTPNVTEIATRGPLTPDHVIRTKLKPVIISDEFYKDIEEYASDYTNYFVRNKDQGMMCLDAAPRWALWPNLGIVSFGKTIKDAKIVADIGLHTIDAIETAEQLGGWIALPEKDIFEIEYWELEQAKLRKNSEEAPLLGKVAIVTGAASGIGRECVNLLCQQGAVVIALDIDDNVTSVFHQSSILPIKCDITKEQQISDAIAKGIEAFGGLDILINNAGIFPASTSIADMPQTTWNSSIAVNLTGHQLMLKHTIPYLENGINPAIVMIASKNVLAPGPGASAYSVAKAGFTQLARVAALELADKGIRVNTIHPDAVFDTGIWTPEILAKRAEHYSMSVEQYKTKNLLKTLIQAKDVAQLACAMAGSLFYKTTGAQVPIDGGNDRVI